MSDNPLPSLAEILEQNGIPDPQESSARCSIYEFLFDGRIPPDERAKRLVTFLAAHEKYVGMVVGKAHEPGPLGLVTYIRIKLSLQRMTLMSSTDNDGSLFMAAVKWNGISRTKLYPVNKLLVVGKLEEVKDFTVESQSAKKPRRVWPTSRP